MNILTILTLIFAFNCCTKLVEKKDFEQFKNKFNEIKLPLTLDDTTVFENWPDKNLIDTYYVNRYSLILKYSHNKYPPKSIQGYQCSHIGRFETRDYVVLLYKIFTTEAGRGNPVVILTIFSNDVKKEDEMIALWNDIEDPFYNHRITLHIPSSNTIEIKSIVKVNGYLDGKIVPKKITEKVSFYAIQNDGKIKTEKEISQDVFIDDNPKILDDFPQE